MRTVIFLFSLLWALLLLLPAVIVNTDAATEVGYPVPVTSAQAHLTAATVIPPLDGAEDDSQILLPFTVNGEACEIALCDYVRGVLYAELPSSFETEAWRALAVAVRTYALYRVTAGLPLSDDSRVSTAYLSDADAKARYGAAYADVYEKADAAVSETVGEVLFYDGAPICSVFHAMSWGSTTSSTAVWGGTVPYLVPVTTPETDDLPDMTVDTVFDEVTLCRMLGVSDALPLVIRAGEDGRAAQVTVADGTAFSGSAFRMALALRSTAVSVLAQDDCTVTLRTRGYGHGVGMSQWGAQLLAREGWDYREILSHYYPGTETVCAEISEILQRNRKDSCQSS